MKSPLDVYVVDISMLSYVLAYGDVLCFEAPLSTIEPFEDLYPNDDHLNYSYNKTWKI